MYFLTFYQKRLTSAASYEVLHAVKVKLSQVFSTIESAPGCMCSASCRRLVLSHLLGNHEPDKHCSNSYIKKSIFRGQPGGASG